MKGNQTQHYTDEAIVLRTVPYREADLIVTLLTRQSGKISALARGARKSRKRFPGGIDIFDCGSFDLQFPRPSATLHMLTACNERFPLSGLRENFTQLSLASFFLEIAHVFIPEGDPATRGMYALLRGALEHLGTGRTEEDQWLCTVSFILRFLEASGYSPRDKTDEIPPLILAWWDLLLSGNSVLTAQIKSLISESMLLLLDEIEALNGKALYTAPSIRQNLARFVRVET